MQHTLPRGVPTFGCCCSQWISRWLHRSSVAGPKNMRGAPMVAVRINRWLHTWMLLGLATVVAVWRALLIETVGVGE